MFYSHILTLSPIHVVQAVLISALFVVLLIAKERRDERKRA